jgi:hypothetical protein
METKEWSLVILNGVHSHKKAPEGHILAGRLRGENKKLVGDLTKNLV